MLASLNDWPSPPASIIATLVEAELLVAMMKILAWQRNLCCERSDDEIVDFRVLLFMRKGPDGENVFLTTLEICIHF